MEDVGKPQYLVRDRAGPKLKRNVPPDLRPLAGRTAWIERVSGLSMAEIRKRSNIFATRTDAEINALRRQLSSSANGDGASTAGGAVTLSDVDVQQVALRFFLDSDRANVESGAYFADQRSLDFPDILSDAGNDYAEAIREAAGDPSYSDRTALKALVEYGFAPATLLPQDRRSTVSTELAQQRWFQYLCRLIERAQVELARRRLEALKSGAMPPVADELFRPAAPTQAANVRLVPGGPRKTVADLIEAFTTKKKVEVGPSRQSQFQVPMRALEEELGPRYPVADITRQHCKDLAALFVRIPAYVGQHYKGLRLREAADAYERKHGVAANRHDEGTKHLAVLRNAFAFAVNEEWMNDNPALKVEVVRPVRQAKKHETKGQKYQPFDLDDLKAIFGGDYYSDRHVHPLTSRRSRNGKYEPHRFWTPLLALWTGARMNEILQLERADLREAEGVRFIAVTDEDELEYEPGTFTKRLKTAQSVRDIPLHPELIRMGFWDWAEARGPGRLFPEAKQPIKGKPSDIYSKRFKTLLAGCGVWVPRRKVFHSFRNSFTDALRDAGVSEEMRTAINGWSSQRAMDSRYGRGHKVVTLYAEIQKAAYPGLDLSHLYQGA